MRSVSPERERAHKVRDREIVAGIKAGMDATSLGEMFAVTGERVRQIFFSETGIQPRAYRAAAGIKWGPKCRQCKRGLSNRGRTGLCRTCLKAAHRVDRICQTCGKAFQVRTNDIQRGGWSRGNYCSRFCLGQQSGRLYGAAALRRAVARKTTDLRREMDAVQPGSAIVVPQCHAPEVRGRGNMCKAISIAHAAWPRQVETRHVRDGESYSLVVSVLLERRSQLDRP